MSLHSEEREIGGVLLSIMFGVVLGAFAAIAFLFIGWVVS